MAGGYYAYTNIGLIKSPSHKNSNIHTEEEGKTFGIICSALHTHPKVYGRRNSALVMLHLN